MTKKELLEKTYESAYDAMNALANFLKELNSPLVDESPKDYQHLRVVGNRIFE